MTIYRALDYNQPQLQLNNLIAGGEEMNMETQKYQEIYHLNSFDDESYPWVLVILGVIALGFFTVTIFLFHSIYWGYGILSLFIGSIFGFFVTFCSRGYFLSRKEKKNKQKEANNEKRL